MITENSAALKLGITTQCGPFTTIYPKHHSYSSALISLSLELLSKSRMGLRTCLNLLSIIRKYFPGVGKLPCVNTLRNWRLKWSHYQMTQAVDSSNGKWCLIVDESISLGGQKILLILGLRLEDYDLSLPLCFSDVRVLSVELSSSWPAHRIAQQFKQLQKRGVNIGYVVSDQGPNIVKAVKEQGFPLIGDCGHRFALILKKTYGKLPEFERFMSHSSKIKRQGALSQYAHLLPPRHRAHSRFMHLRPLVKWALKINQLIDQQADHPDIAPFLKNFKWVQQYQDLVLQLDRTLSVTNTILRALKAEGISLSSVKWTTKILRKAAIPKSIKIQIDEYLQQSLRTAQGYQSVICSSDIIESYFGYYKNRISHKVGPQCLTIAEYGSKFSICEVTQAMQHITIKKLNEKLRIAFPATVTRKRIALFKLVEG